MPKQGNETTPYSFTMPIAQAMWGNLVSQSLTDSLDRFSASMKELAEATRANAEATVLLARATAGEFEPGDEPQGEQYLDGTPKT